MRARRRAESTWAIAAAVAIGVACSGGGGSGGGGTGGTVGGGSGGGAGGAMTMAGGSGGAGGAGAALDCQPLRECVLACMDDACAAACKARGSATALQLLQNIDDCTVSYCAATDVQCICTEQCFPDGRCVDEVSACLTQAMASDQLCDFRCR